MEEKQFAAFPQAAGSLVGFYLLECDTFTIVMNYILL